MAAKQDKTYLLAPHKQDFEQSAGMFELFIDASVQGDRVNQNVLKKLKVNDTLAVSNIQSLGKSVSEIVETLNIVAQCRINLCLIRENLSFKANKLTDIVSSLLLALRLQHSLISLRAKETSQDRKAKGVKLGRPYGSNTSLKLDDYKEGIKKLLLSGASKDDIAEKFNVCRATVYNFVKKNPELLSEI